MPARWYPSAKQPHEMHLRRVQLADADADAPCFPQKERAAPTKRHSPNKGISECTRVLYGFPQYEKGRIMRFVSFFFVFSLIRHSAPRPVRNRICWTKTKFMVDISAKIYYTIQAPRKNASVAQSVEQGTENPRVGGSIPPGGTIYAAVAHLVERHLAKVEVASSSLVSRSTQSLSNGQAFVSSARKTPRQAQGCKTRCLHLRSIEVRGSRKTLFCGVMLRVRASSAAPTRKNLSKDRFFLVGERDLNMIDDMIER